MVQVQVEVLKAYYGDSIFLTICHEDINYIIVIDGGTPRTYCHSGRYGRSVDGPLKNKLAQLKKEDKAIDLLIITHVDDDHIGGVLAWFKDQMPTIDFVKHVWMNDDVEINVGKGLDNTSAQAASLKKLLGEINIPLENHIVKGREFAFEWGRMVTLAPTIAHHNKVSKDIGKELNNAVNERYDENIKSLIDESYDCGKCTPENDASMAFLLQTNEGENILMLGDADIDMVIDSLKHVEGITLPLKCSWVKLSHHGSKNNFKPELLDIIDADNFIVSTNGMNFGHPDKEVIAYIVAKTKARMWFNYPERAEKLFTEQDKLDYPDINNRLSFFE